MQFPLQNPGIWFYKTKGITIVNTELLDCLGLYISSAPVEGKGYKRILKLPDWLNNQHNMIKSPKQYAGSRIYPVTSCPFLTLTYVRIILVRIFFVLSNISRMYNPA